VKETEKAPSTISWHLKKLKDAKLIEANNKHGKPCPYKLRNKNVVARILSKHKGAFV
jgi:DNA-binding transcriptional ArsR family regulator